MPNHGEEGAQIPERPDALLERFGGRRSGSDRGRAGGSPRVSTSVAILPRHPEVPAIVGFRLVSVRKVGTDSCEASHASELQRYGGRQVLEGWEPQAVEQEKEPSGFRNGSSRSLEFNSPASVYRRYLVCGHTE